MNKPRRTTCLSCRAFCCFAASHSSTTPGASSARSSTSEDPQADPHAESAASGTESEWGGAHGSEADDRPCGPVSKVPNASGLPGGEFGGSTGESTGDATEGWNGISSTGDCGADSNAGSGEGSRSNTVSGSGSGASSWSSSSSEGASGGTSAASGSEVDDFPNGRSSYGECHEGNLSSAGDRAPQRELELLSDQDGDSQEGIVMSSSSSPVRAGGKAGAGGSLFAVAGSPQALAHGSSIQEHESRKQA